MYKLSETLTNKLIFQKWSPDKYKWIYVTEFSSIEEANIYFDLNSIPKNAIAKESIEDFIYLNFDI